MKRNMLRRVLFLVFLLSSFSFCAIKAQEVSWDDLHALLENYQSMSEEEKAVYGLNYYRKSIEKDVPVPPVELIDFSIGYFARKKQKQQLANSYLCKAQSLHNQRMYADAIRNLFLAKEQLDETKDHNLLGDIYFSLGRIAGHQNEIEKNLDYFRLAENHFEKAGDARNLAKVYMVTGWIYMAKEDFDAAARSSLRALKLTTDSILIGDLLNDIGNSYFYKEQTDSALYYMYQSIQYPHYNTNLSLRHYNIGNVYSFMGQFDSAYIHVSHALECPVDVYIAEECYRVLTRIALARDDKDNLQRYITMRQVCQDSIRELERQSNIGILEELHQTDKEVSEVKKQRLLLLTLVVFIVLLAFIVVWRLYDHYRRQRLEADTYKTELGKNQEQRLLELKDELALVRQKHAATRKKADFKEKEQIDKNIYNEALLIDNEQAFIRKMNKALNRLPEKLQTKYPNIAHKELIWCCLFMLQIPTTDIALILEYTQSSQYKFKQRLIKKLGFTNTKEFEKMLHDTAGL